MQHEQTPTLIDGTINEIHPFALAASKAGDPDTMHIGEAKKQEDWSEFKHAMRQEVNDFTSREHWELVLRSSLSKAEKFDIVNAIWSFKRKR